MVNITVGRYEPGSGAVMADGSVENKWQGWIKPEDDSWIAFIADTGIPYVFFDLCGGCGGVLVEKHPEDMCGFCYHRDLETHELIPFTDERYK